MGKKKGGGQSAAYIEELVGGIARPVAERHGATLWSVEFAAEAGQRFLRVLLDREGEPVDLDLCEAVSRELDGLLDERDPIESSYFLEVGSAGLDRPLKRQSDFDMFSGRRVDVSLYAPIVVEGAKQKRFEATLAGLADGVLTLILDDNTELSLPKSSAASVRLAIQFD